MENKEKVNETKQEDVEEGNCTTSCEETQEEITKEIEGKKQNKA